MKRIVTIGIVCFLLIGAFVGNINFSNENVRGDNNLMNDGEGTGIWTNMTTATKPSSRLAHGMATIYGTDKVVLFGGSTGSFDDETWLYDLSANQWTKMNPTTFPSARTNHEMVTIYDTDKIVFFGGCDASTYWNGDTWEYDLSDNQWSNKNPSTKPSDRYGHAMANVYGTDKVVLFGGDVPGANDETWVYDLSDNIWTQQTPSTSPPARLYHDMATIYNDDKVVLFGGADHTNHLQDTWIYDLSDNQWTNKNPSTKPSSRYKPQVTTVYNDDKIVLFGGGHPGNVYENDTWVYDLSANTWTNKTTNNKPSARINHDMVTVEDKILLFGGDDAIKPYDNETWVYDFSKTIHATIDIKPGSYPNTINMKSKGKIPVAILSSEDFDAPTEIDPTSPTFGKTGEEESLFKCTGPEDVNGDGLEDLVCRFHTKKTGFQVGDTEGILRTLGYDGTCYEGRDSVRILDGEGWAISVNMRFVGGTYSSLVMQARTEDTLYRWGSDGFYGSLFLDEWNLDYTMRYHVELFGNWDNSDTDWHTFEMIANEGVIELVLDGITVNTYAPERPVTSLVAPMLRPGWRTTSEVDWVTAASDKCEFSDQMSYSTLAEAEAGGWVVLSEPAIITATGTSLILDNNGGIGAVIERPLVCI
jgi:N-acetylneuraminic acid mutarotase